MGRVGRKSFRSGDEIARSKGEGLLRGDGLVDLENGDGGGKRGFPGAVERSALADRVEEVFEVGLVNRLIEGDRNVPRGECSSLADVDGGLGRATEFLDAHFFPWLDGRRGAFAGQRSGHDALGCPLVPLGRAGFAVEFGGFRTFRDF